MWTVKYLHVLFMGNAKSYFMRPRAAGFRSDGASKAAPSLIVLSFLDQGVYRRYHSFPFANLIN